jgi:hypothetical protein
VPAPDLVEGHWEFLTPGARAKTGMAGIRISLSNPRMGEVKLSKSCIQAKHENLRK